MKLDVLNDNGTVNSHTIDEKDFKQKSLEHKVGYISSQSKEENALRILQAYYSASKAILFDETNRLIKEKLNTLDINSLENKESHPTVFDDKDFSMMFFTSGSTGESVGALKTSENLEKEVEILTALLKEYNIKKVIVTVPFIHIYGTLVGLLYPLLNDIDIILKEHFLPNDLLNIIEDNSLIVTTPLYIKALNKTTKERDLKHSLFISSTAPLDSTSAKQFKNKFNTNVMQLFGSTETGGIAYKYNDDSLWTPLDKVSISTNDSSELKVQSPFISHTLYDNEFKNTQTHIQTFDYVEIHNNKFKLVGRSSQILKISGKRYSTIQIEEILEKEKHINKALVFVKNGVDNLRDEVLRYYIRDKTKLFKQRN